ncbi:MAG: PDR/VanB family oxidoreductase [Sphingobium sp.]
MTEGEMEVRVIRKVQEAEGIASFYLASCDGSVLPSFSAGSHIDVHTPAGPVRQYSLCNSAQKRDHYQIAILKDPQSRGGSVSMHEDIEAGSILRISTPRNHFPLMEVDGSPLLLAGGIGVTPILCMAERLSASDAMFEMHYFARSRSSMAFQDRIRSSGFASQVQCHFDDEIESRIDLGSLLQSPAPGRRIYVCGPLGFLEAVRSMAVASGWPNDQVHFEYFAAAPIEPGSTSAFTVTLASSGQVLDVPEDKSVADVLLDNGIDLPLSCEQGVCGTCVTRILEGTPDHRDMYFSDEERAADNQFTPCCSRAKTSNLLLDL